MKLILFPRTGAAVLSAALIACSATSLPAQGPKTDPATAQAAETGTPAAEQQNSLLARRSYQFCKRYYVKDCPTPEELEHSLEQAIRTAAEAERWRAQDPEAFLCLCAPRLLTKHDANWFDAYDEALRQGIVHVDSKSGDLVCGANRRGIPYRDLYTGKLECY